MKEAAPSGAAFSFSGIVLQIDRGEFCYESQTLNGSHAMARGHQAIQALEQLELPDGSRLKPSVEDLTDSAFFSNMSKEQLDFLLQGASCVEIARGEPLRTDDGLEHPLYSLLTGRIKISLTATSGNERIVDMVLPGQVSCSRTRS